MALSDAIKAEASRKPGPKCSTCLLISTLDDADQAALEEAMADRTITTAAICRALGVEGHRVTPINLQRHRNRECNRP
jgi:hypothetical protein